MSPSLLSLLQIRFLQLETGTVCNYRCRYCPVAEHPRQGGFMPLAWFDKIVRDLADLQQLERIYLNGYEEPTLNPDLGGIVERLAPLGAQLVLLTNATNLSVPLLNRLAQSGARVQLDIHLSAVTCVDFQRLHQSTLLGRVMKNLEGLRDHPNCADFDVQIGAQLRETAEDARAFALLQDRFSTFPFEVHRWSPNDRAGHLRNEYFMNNYHRVLRGCGLENRTSEWLHISARGNAVICCQDYFETEVIGNVARQTIVEIASSDARRRVHEWAMGEVEAPESFICRRCKFALSAPQALDRCAR